MIEFKVNGKAVEAMKQIEEKHYAPPFATDDRKLIKIGLGFSKEPHNISSSIIN